MPIKKYADQRMPLKSKTLPDIRGLEVFIAVIAAGSMTAAARQLDIGQPGITRAVRDLETVLGFDLFIRNGPRITPSPKGLLFYEDAKRLLSSYDRISERAARLRDTQLRELVIAATPTMAAGIVPDLLAAIDDDLPAQLRIPTMDAEHLSQSLIAAEADYGLSSLPLAGEELECIALAKSRLVAAIPAQSEVEVLSLRSLAEERLLSVGNSYRIRNRLDAALVAHGLEPREELITNTSLNAMMAARKGLGIAIVDPVSGYGIPIEGLKTVPLDVEIPYEWGLFRRRGHGLDAIETTLIAAFERVARSLGASAGSAE